MDSEIFARDPVEISTGRLIIRPTRIDDAQKFNGICDDGLFIYVPQITVPFDAEVWLRDKFQRSAPRIGHTLVRRDGLAPIGFIQAEVNPVGLNESYTEIGYWIGRSFLRQGFATEAVQALLAYFNQPRAWPVFASVDKRNSASIALLKKCGFEKRKHGPRPDTQGMKWYRWLPDVPARVSF